MSGIDVMEDLSTMFEVVLSFNIGISCRSNPDVSIANGQVFHYYVLRTCVPEYLIKYLST